MPGRQREVEVRWSGSAVLDLVTRWFRARAGPPPETGVGEHAHWDPVNRTWQYHTHRRDRRSRRP